MTQLFVTADTQQRTLGQLTFATTSYRCALGRSGIHADKTEGDGATPIGTFPFRRLFYRADRLSAPQTNLPIQAIRQNDGWCDAPDDRNYNCFVQLPYGASAENLWRDDRIYDLIFVIGHNDDPVVPNLGSAIFMHVASPDYGPTAGCIALAESDLLDIARVLRPGSTLTINPPAG